jgi:hypothetical protein
LDYVYTLNLQAQGQTIDDLLSTMNKIKEHIAAGYGMAHDMNDSRRYALSIEKEGSDQGESIT